MTTTTATNNITGSLHLCTMRFIFMHRGEKKKRQPPTLLHTGSLRFAVEWKLMRAHKIGYIYRCYPISLCVIFFQHFFCVCSNQARVWPLLLHSFSYCPAFDCFYFICFGCACVFSCNTNSSLLCTQRLERNEVCVNV